MLWLAELRTKTSRVEVIMASKEGGNVTFRPCTGGNLSTDVRKRGREQQRLQWMRCCVNWFFEQAQKHKR